MGILWLFASLGDFGVHTTVSALLVQGKHVLELLGALQGIGVLALTAWGVFIAQRGLDTWSAQLRGTAAHDLARRCLLSTLRMREAIGAARNSFIPPGEQVAALRAIGLSEEQVNEELAPGRGTKIDAAVYQQRLIRLSDVLVAFQADCLEAEAVWGDEINKRCLEIGRLTNRFRWAVHVTREMRAPTNPIDAEAFRKRIEEANAILWADFPSGEANAFGAEVKTAIESLVALLRPYIAP